ncbi:Glycosyltransferase involved in cell wall bisynthesis [Dyadobacter koreensis]|uniref:Glycosyltransferase involved in cell wall bisynthesis n=1 Tax=Dyadobacter koreensis TaxID=408657 RepID=A0A1H6RFF7_9BACT|nr:glycosyltransferase family 4 protein [Dyadobacter koreensis]SEI52034.1 Glycosyltransferase involved in cell wall bisynthesis [Dyadobacter koreensis]
MIKKKLFIVEQYLSWKGHYRQYFENLISNDFFYIYCSSKKQSYPNSTFLEAEEKDFRTFTDFIKGRFLDSFKAYSKLVDEKPSVAHLLEFEPFSFFYLLLFKRNHIPLLIITIHSIERMRYANKLKDAISYLQRLVYQYTLRKAAMMGATFVTHYEHHRNQLISLIGNKYVKAIYVINYPCPEVSHNNNQTKNNSTAKFLIYGQIREDKGIFEFLSNSKTLDLNITIAGKIHDPRILNLNHPNLEIINKFITDEELIDLVRSHSFMLLPYLETYTGGAGTLKDSIAYGLPIVASDIPIFKEVIQRENLGFIFKEVNEIKAFSDITDSNKYDILKSNCLTYAQKYNWENMRQQYFHLYEMCISKSSDRQPT